MKSYNDLLAHAVSQIKTPAQKKREEKIAAEKAERKIRKAIKRQTFAKALGIGIDQLPSLCTLPKQLNKEVRSGVVWSRMLCEVTFRPPSTPSGRWSYGEIVGGLWTIDIASIYCPENAELSSWQCELQYFPAFNFIVSFTYSQRLA